MCPALAADEALECLMEGNRRFMDNASQHPRIDPERRGELTGGQSPFAIILTCSDSRVVPEHIFDQGLGDIFGIQVAGNVLDDVVIGSIEYAVAHLDTKLVMVLGHEGCGAITAALAGGEPEGHLGPIMEALAPAVKFTNENAAKAPDRLDTAIMFNAMHVASQLRECQPILADAEGLKVVPAVYHLGSGRVELLD